MNSSGLIFDVDRNSQVDGPGLRTVVFLKGCPLRCWWCHNPESQANRPEILHWADRCAGCGQCLETCPHKAVSFSREGRRLLDRRACRGCGECVASCPNQALALAGRSVEPSEMVDQIVGDAPFFRRSGGGATLSGGEPLLQADFCRELLQACVQEGIHVAVDICGQVAWPILQNVLPLVGLVLYDLKHVDPQKHLQATGASNELILTNLARLIDSAAEYGFDLTVRVPVIPGFNDRPVELAAILTRLADLGLAGPVELLPFHNYSRSKYLALGRPDPYPGLEPPSAGLLSRAVEIGRDLGLTVETA